jgi:type IV pilus assembly protein PilW
MSVTLNNVAGVVVGGNLACLGAWDTVTYVVNNGNLERNGIPVVAGVVNLQAQYGISTTANSNQVNQWVDATAATGFATPSVADRNRIKAVRIAIIARNSKIERSAVSTACSSTSAATPTGLCAWSGVAVGGAITTASPAPTVDLSADANWARYRYRVFETVIPLRNMVWSRETL